MAVVNSGKAFASGEQLTADKLNLMFSGSNFSTGAIDSSTISLNSEGKLTVNQITSANIANNALSFSDIQQVDTNKLLGRTSAGAGDIEELTIESIRSSFQPFFVDISGSTGGSSNPNVSISGASQQTYTYNISELTSNDSRFDVSKCYMLALTVQTHVIGDGSTANAIMSYIFPDESGDGSSTISVAGISQMNTGDFHTREYVLLPINANQTTIQLVVEQTDSINFTLQGFMQFGT